MQLWVARFNEGGIGGLRDASGRGRASRARYGRIRRLADRLAGRNMPTPRKLRKYLKSHDGVEILYLPTATPKLSVAESVWKSAKYGSSPQNTTRRGRL